MRGEGWTGATAGDFDLYVLQLFWSPAFCCSPQALAQNITCSSVHRSRLVLHGLWPEYSKDRIGTDGNGEARSHQWPQYCDDYASCYSCNETGFCASNFTTPLCRLERNEISSPQLRDDLAQYAPGYWNTTMGDHEWIKHGSCSGLSPQSYLQSALEAQKNVVTADAMAGVWKGMEALAGSSVRLATLESLFPRDSSIIQTDKDSNFWGVSACLSKTNNTPVKCPWSTRKYFQRHGFRDDTQIYIPAASELPGTCFGEEEPNNYNLHLLSLPVVCLAVLLFWLPLRKGGNSNIIPVHRHLSLVPQEEKEAGAAYKYTAIEMMSPVKSR